MADEILTMNAQRFALEQWNFGCTVVRLASVSCLVVGYVRQYG